VIERRRRRRANGSTSTTWRVRWHDESGAERNKTFDRVADARVFEAKIPTPKRTGDLAELDAGTETLAEFWEEWWQLHAQPNLERATLELYGRMWPVHVQRRLGDRGLRDLTPQAIARYRADLEADGVGVEAIRKTLTMLQGVLQRAVEWQRVRSNPFKLARKPPAQRLHAVRAMTPTVIEVMRADLLGRGRRRDAMLVVLLGYAGLRPQEALGLQWRHVRKRTILVERAVSDGQVKALKNRSQPRTIDLLGPLLEDLAAWRRTRRRVDEGALLFQRPDGELWRKSDWRNWRKRIYAPAAASAGVRGARPYDLRHSFASSLIHEGRLSIVDIAAQMGHRPTVCLDTYAHVLAEQRGAPSVSAEERILAARAQIALTPRGLTGPIPARR
jgi:integrase